MAADLMEFLTSTLEGRVFSLTGSGGKTSLMRALALHLKGKGASVLVTTTTRLLRPELYGYGADRVYLDETIEDSPKAPGTAEFFALPFSDRKVRSPDPAFLARLVGRYDYSLIEADGAAGLPLKLHRPNEPVVLPQTTSTIVLAGLRDWGGTVKAENFLGLAPRYEGRRIDERLLADLIQDGDGLLKGARGKTAVLLNQSETAALDCSIVRHYFQSVYKASVRENRIEL